MATRKLPRMDFAQVQERLRRQFQNLDPKDPSLWPILPRILLCLFIATGVAAALWYFKLTEYEDELITERTSEQQLRDDFQKKLVKAVSLDVM